MLHAKDDPALSHDESEAYRRKIMSYRESGKLLKIKAVAVAGKTTLIKEYVTVVSATAGEPTLVLCFNEQPQKDLSNALRKEGVVVRTSDSLFTLSGAQMVLSMQDRCHLSISHCRASHSSITFSLFSFDIQRQPPAYRRRSHTRGASRGGSHIFHTCGRNRVLVGCCLVAD
jgi:hypothetical protein